MASHRRVQKPSHSPFKCYKASGMDSPWLRVPILCFDSRDKSSLIKKYHDTCDPGALVPACPVRGSTGGESDETLD